MEHMILFAICTLIMGLRFMISVEGDEKIDGTVWTFGEINACFFLSAVFAFPWWLGLEFIVWVLPKLLNLAVAVLAYYWGWQF